MLAVAWTGIRRPPIGQRDRERTCARSDMLKLLEHVALSTQVLSETHLAPASWATCSSCAPSDTVLVEDGVGWVEWSETHRTMRWVSLHSTHPTPTGCPAAKIDSHTPMRRGQTRFVGTGRL